MNTKLIQNRKLIFGLVPIVIVIALIEIPGAFSGCGYLSSFEKTLDPVAIGSRIDNCHLCHINNTGGGELNPYGKDFMNHSYNFSAIEQLDSDGDG